MLSTHASATALSEPQGAWIEETGGPSGLAIDEHATHAPVATLVNMANEDASAEVCDAELDDGLHCVRCKPGSALCGATTAFAAARYGLPEHLVVAAEDEYSDIFVFLTDHSIVATAAVTRDAVGPIEAREFYPKRVLAAFGPQIATFYRLVTRRDCPNLAVTAMRVACRYSLDRGVRLALFSAKPKMIPWYRRMGFTPLSPERFVHPRLGSEHVTLCCPADPDRASVFVDLFQAIDTPLYLSDVQAVAATN